METRVEQGKPEYERLLFYRRIGNFQSPLQVTVSPDETEMWLTTANPFPIRDLFNSARLGTL